MKKALLTIAIFGSFLFLSPCVVGQTLDERLHYAAEEGKLDQIEALLRSGANIEAKVRNRPTSPYVSDMSKRTPLMAAAMYGRSDAVALLLKKRANIEAIDDFQNTALILAAGEGRMEVVTLLIKKGAKIDAKGLNGTALHWAADEGHSDIVQLLLEKGANIEEDSVDGTPLMVAAKNGRADTVEMLLSKGAKIETTKASGTALDFAAAKGQTSVVRLLLAKGANIEAANTYGETALMLAIMSQRPEAARLFIEKGANINARSSERATPLIMAALFSQPEIVQILLDKGADIEAETGDGITSLLAGTCSTKNEAGKLATVKLLLSRGANMNAKYKDGATALTCATKTKSVAVVELLEKTSQERKVFEQTDAKPPTERFSIYVEALRRDPQNEFLREKVLQSVTALPERPAIPDDARQLFMQASAQIKQSTTPESLGGPIASLRKAIAIAPWWANAYYNLSRALELSGRYDDAARQLNNYLKLNPPEADAREARAHLAEIMALKTAAQKQ